MVVGGRRGEMVSQYIFSLTSFFLRLQVTTNLATWDLKKRETLPDDNFFAP